MAGSTIVIDADNGKLDAASRKSAGEVRKIANEAKNVGTQMNKWGSQLAAKVGGLSAILGTINAIGEEVERQRSRAAEANKAVGGGSMGRSDAIRELGLDRGPGGADAVNEVIRNGAGGASIAERDAFLAAMAGKKGRDRIKPQVSMQALSLFNSGLYSQEELLTAASRGEKGIAKLRSEQVDRFNNLSEKTRSEHGLRKFERESNNRTEDALYKRGQSARVVEARMAERDATQNQYLTGALNTAKALPLGVGPAVSAVDTWLQEIGIGQLKAMNEVVDNTRKMSRPPPSRPSLAPTPDGMSP